MRGRQEPYRASNARARPSDDGHGELGNAEAGEDYVAASGTLTFRAGATRKTVAVTVLDDTHAEGKEVMLLMIKSATGAQMGDRVAKGTIKDDDAASASAARSPVAPALSDAEALAPVTGLSPREAAAALFGEVELDSARLRALDDLGNRNGRYDHGDLISWVERCRRGGADCGDGTGTTPAGSPLPPNGQGGRRSGRNRRYGGRSGPDDRSGHPGERSRRRPPAKPAGDGSGTAPRRRAFRIRFWGSVAVVASLAAWACTGDNPTGPRTDAPAAPLAAPDVERPLRIALAMPPASRDIGAMLRVEGAAIDSVRAPGRDLFESEAATSGGRQVVLAGRLSSGTILELWVPAGRDPADYHVELLEVAAEDYSLRDLAGYSVSVGR